MGIITFIHTPVPELQDDRLEPPLGLLYLATYLRKHGIDANVVDLSGQSKWDIPKSDYYGFSTYSTSYHRTLQIKEMLPKAKTIAGGPHATALPNEVSKDFDYVIVGEGENPLLCLLQGKPINTEIIQDLDDLPYPDYSLVNIHSYNRIVAGKPSISILSSRGCPYHCLFCNSNIMGGHKKTRFRSPGNVVNEIKCLLETYGNISFRFQDDIFGIDFLWLSEFTKLVKPLDIMYRAFVRANQCAKPNFTDMLYDGGCRHISLGIETGSDIILKTMKKGQTVKDGILGISNAKKSGLIVRIYLIIGFPGETWDTINQTLEFIDKTHPDEFVVYPLIPYPGTPLYHYPDFYGLKNIDIDFTKYFQIYGESQSHFMYDLDNVDRQELQCMKDYVVDKLEKQMNLKWAKNSNGYI